MVLAVALAIAVAAQCAVYLGIRAKFSASACDAFSVAAVALVCVGALVYKGEYLSRQVCVTLLMCAWSARLCRHILLRARNSAARVQEYVAARAAWTTLVALPAVFLNVSYDYGTHPGMFRQPEDLPFALLALAAVALEHVADERKRAFYAEAAPRAGEAAVCREGPWRWSRHPNHFGEVLFHASVYVLVAKHTPVAAVAGVLITVYACVLSDGGTAGLESRRHSANYAQPWYRAYKKQTSPLVPLPPDVYARVPFWAKRLFLFELAAFEAQTFHAAVPAVRAAEDATTTTTIEGDVHSV
jgi:steroid 5-alpha reductase family enzyme